MTGKILRKAITICGAGIVVLSWIQTGIPHSPNIANPLNAAFNCSLTITLIVLVILIYTNLIINDDD